MFIIVIEGLSVLKKRKKNLPTNSLLLQFANYRPDYFENSRPAFLIIGIAIKNENFWIPRGYLFSFFFFFLYIFPIFTILSSIKINAESG